MGYLEEYFSTGQPFLFSNNDSDKKYYKQLLLQ